VKCPIRPNGNPLDANELIHATMELEPKKLAVYAVVTWAGYNVTTAKIASYIGTPTDKIKNAVLKLANTYLTRIVSKPAPKPAPAATTTTVPMQATTPTNTVGTAATLSHPTTGQHGTKTQNKKPNKRQGTGFVLPPVY
jgi:hypothetical protein